MICKNKHCSRCMRWKKEHNKPADFSVGIGGGMSDPGILFVTKKIRIGKEIIAHGGGSHD